MRPRASLRDPNDVQNDDTTSSDATDTRPTTSRRNFLRAAAAGAGAATLTATSGCLDLILGPSGGGGIGSLGDTAGNVPTSINPENYADHFDEVVNAANVGADPNGETPIDGVLNSYARPGTLLVFPEGRYTMASPYRHTGSGNIGIIGQNATLRHSSVDSISGHTVTSGQYRGDTILFAIGRASSPHSGTLVLGGFTVDDREKNHGMQLLRLYSTGLADVRNIRFVGQQDLGTRGPFRAMTRADDTLAMFVNIDFRYGALHAERTINEGRTSGIRSASWSTSGFCLGSEQSGTMYLENVICGAFPDNGLYLKGGLPQNDVGRKILRNCVAANSNVANIRTNSGDDFVPHPLIDGSRETPAQGYERSVVENCEVIIDRKPSAAYGNQRGIRLDDGDPILRNTTVSVHKANGHAINVQGGTNGATVQNCQINLYEPEIGIRVSGSNTELQNNTVNLYGFDGGTVLSGTSPGPGVAINRVSQNTQQ